MKTNQDLVFLLDCDNTLLDNDAIQDDLKTHLNEVFGTVSCERYWGILEQGRRELGYVDYLGALQRYRLSALEDPRMLQMSAFLIDYPFRDRLYPGALEVIKHLAQWGPTVILSDGDVVFQPRKVKCSGLWQAVEGRVLIYIHKEDMLDDVARQFPARHYVMVDDKLRILNAMKAIWKNRVTTVFPRQGRYASDPHVLAHYRPADIAVDTIAALLEYDFSQRHGRHGNPGSQTLVPTDGPG